MGEPAIRRRPRAGGSAVGMSGVAVSICVRIDLGDDRWAEEDIWVEVPADHITPDLKTARPGWFIGVRGHVAHFAPEGADTYWMTACGRRLLYHGTPVRNIHTVQICRRCHERTPAGAIANDSTSGWSA